MLDYVVLFQSDTGNTAKIATEIFTALPGMNKDLLRVDMSRPIPDARQYFVGFAVNRGTCIMEVADLLSELHEKKIALFATCGAAPITEYKKGIETKVQVWLDDDNTYLGFFLCQGKMPPETRDKYESLRNAVNQDTINLMLQNFEEAKLHPSRQDSENAQNFAKRLI